MRIDILKILKRELIGKEVDTYYYDIANNKLIGNIYSTGIIEDVYLNNDNPEDIGFTISAKLTNGKAIQLEPSFNNIDAYYEGQ